MTGWQPVTGHLLTRWGEQVNPENAWQEYPRPQMTRPAWQNLNGLWDYAITPKEHPAPAAFSGKILVPFPLESALSGVKRNLKPNERLWYRRAFAIPAAWRGMRVLLHFGAVDWDAGVWVNGEIAGTHRGGYLPFSFDISAVLLPGENELLVSAWDPGDAFWQQRGKQVRVPKSIWYTQCSGIWQTVWLEPVPDTYITSLKITPDIDHQVVKIAISLGGAKNRSGEWKARVLDAGRLAAEGRAASAQSELSLSLPQPQLWSPRFPHLYDLDVEIPGDKIFSYFGMRKFSLAKDPLGRLRMCLNNQPLFQFGPLDQGYWPDGLYTPPSAAAMHFDLEKIQELGCNMLRKHVKVEPARFYYDCDRLGLIVWQDMINGGKPVGDVTSFLTILWGSRHDDTRHYSYAGRALAESRQDYLRELREMVDHLYNFPCIAVWVPFNEGWGQFNAVETAAWLKEYDPTRLVDHASGWFDQGAGDFFSRHVYFKKITRLKPQRQRGAALTEFGGYSLKIPAHLWNPDAEFGYRKFPNTEELTGAYLALLENQLKPCIQAGLSAAIYTQTTDVEIEVNGYLTYDREVEKMDFTRLRAAHQKMLAEANKI